MHSSDLKTKQLGKREKSRTRTRKHKIGSHTSLIHYNKMIVVF